MSKDLFSNVELMVFDFDGVFTDNTVMVSEDGIESVICFRSDGLGLSRAKSIGVSSLILSTETNPVVSVRAKKLGIECIQGVTDKGSAIESIGLTCNKALDKILYVGNDINDIPAFKKVGIPVGVADMYEEARPFVKFITNNRGGRGAVREVCDRVFEAGRILG